MSAKSIDRNTRLFFLVSAIGVAYFGLTILLLSLFDYEFNPISQVASDYGIGHFALEMNLGFLVAGIGLITFATALQRTPHKTRAGSILFIIGGLVLIMDSYFTTNLEGTPATQHAIIHGFGGLIFFITAPLGTLIVTRKYGRSKLLTALLGLIIGFVLLGSNAGLGGLAERIILLVIFSTVIAASIGFTRVSKG